MVVQEYGCRGIFVEVIKQEPCTSGSCDKRLVFEGEFAAASDAVRP